jgi:hypothetical protein
MYSWVMRHLFKLDFIERVEQIMTAIFYSLEIKQRFGDFKSALEPNLPKIRRVPDSAFMTYDGQLRLVGEFKTPWIDSHNLSEITKRKVDLRRMLGKKMNQSQQNQPLTFYSGQIADYLRLTKLKFGFLSTYEQPIFLQQKQDTNGQLVLYYSLVIHHSSKGDPGEQVSLRQ